MWYRTVNSRGKYIGFGLRIRKDPPTHIPRNQVSEGEGTRMWYRTVNSRGKYIGFGLRIETRTERTMM